VVIFFHGGFGAGNDGKERGNWGVVDDGKARSSWVNNGNFVLFTPTGKERTDLPGAIVDKASTFSNCDLSKSVTVYGSSHGCTFVHKVMVENQRPELRKFGCFYSQLYAWQANEFESYAPANLGRMLWSFVGTADTIVPPEGGSVGKKMYSSIRETSELWASVYSNGTEVLETTEDCTPHDSTYTITKHSMLGDRVAWWELEGFGHGSRCSFLYEKMAELINLMDGYDGTSISTSSTQSPTQSSSMTCKTWCAPTESDWPVKCNWQNCAGCEECSQ